MSKVIQVSFKDTPNELILYELIKSKSSPGATIKDILKEHFKHETEVAATRDRTTENEIDDIMSGISI